MLCIVSRPLHTYLYKSESGDGTWKHCGDIDWTNRRRTFMVKSFDFYRYRTRWSCKVRSLICMKVFIAFESGGVHCLANYSLNMLYSIPVYLCVSALKLYASLYSFHSTINRAMMMCVISLDVSIQILSSLLHESLNETIIEKALTYASAIHLLYNILVHMALCEFSDFGSIWMWTIET